MAAGLHVQAVAATGAYRAVVECVGASAGSASVTVVYSAECEGASAGVSTVTGTLLVYVLAGTLVLGDALVGTLVLGDSLVSSAILGDALVGTMVLVDS